MGNCRYICMGVALTILLSGCSSSFDSPLVPSLTHQAAQPTHHAIMGFWHGIADPSSGEFELVPVHSGTMHLNVLNILETGSAGEISWSNVSFDGLICDVDITLTHPFPTLTQFTGFDVAGIFISHGSLTGFDDPDLIMPGSGDTRLLNPDGYTRWWNPVEFSSPPGLPILRYRDGAKGISYEEAGYNATLNGYKLFADELSKNEDIFSVNPSHRLEFTDLESNTRHYIIDFSGGNQFNYAVDANWDLPDGEPPFDPDEFPISANRPEAWGCRITEINNSLFNNGTSCGGGLNLTVELLDHQNVNLNKLTIESPGNFAPVSVTTILEEGVGFCTYSVSIENATPSQGSIDLLISAESEVTGYGDLLPEDALTAYFTHMSLVPLQPGDGPPVAKLHASSGDIYPDQSKAFDATQSTGNPYPDFTWDFDGDGIYGESPDDVYTGPSDKPSHTYTDIGIYSVTAKAANVYGESISNTVKVHVVYDESNIYVDADYEGDDSVGSITRPFKTVGEAISIIHGSSDVNPPHHAVHVDYCDGGDHYYDLASGPTLAQNLHLYGDNWNGGGPGKPKLKNSEDPWVVGGETSHSFSIDNFEVGLGHTTNYQGYKSVYIDHGSGSNSMSVTVSHCRFAGTFDANSMGKKGCCFIWVSGADYTHIHDNEFGPFTWNYNIQATNNIMVCPIWLSYAEDASVHHNYFHDLTLSFNSPGNVNFNVIHMDYPWGHDNFVRNNLITHIKMGGTGDIIFTGIRLFWYGNQVTVLNNTIDNIDMTGVTSNSLLRGFFSDLEPYYYQKDWSVTNSLVSNFHGGSQIVYSAYESEVYKTPISYSTGFNLGPLLMYFKNMDEGFGCIDYPGLNPKYINNTSPPYDYNILPGSMCEYGNPDYVDWDDTGNPSGDPYELDLNKRSRTGCFGGPLGDWDPYDL